MRGQYISSFIGGRDNNFNLIRFFAASGVLYSHCYPLSGRGWGPVELFFAKTWGELAVDIFFISSGFLIANSYARKKSNIDFILSRILRIFPGLLVAVLFSALVIGWGVTTASSKVFFSHPELLNFIINNTLLVVGNIRYSLIGVFENNPHPNAINGSLWTLPYEIKMYFYLFSSGLVFDFLNKKFNINNQIKFLYLLFTIAISCIYISIDYFSIKDIHFVKLLLMFFIGVNIYNYKDKIKLNFECFILSLLIILFFAITNKNILQYIYIFILPYVLFYLVYIPKGLIRKFNLIGDYSYGIYIYAFPIQQYIIYKYPHISFFMYFLSSFILTLILSILSWYLIEEKALRLKGKIVKKS
jgi:peptidoglycan/LPS O-acetylase OafA/YrhL